eukprot:1183998-Prorocentrum_minimum.AAC.3
MQSASSRLLTRSSTNAPLAGAGTSASGVPAARFEGYLQWGGGGEGGRNQVAVRGYSGECGGPAVPRGASPPYPPYVSQA